jgi:hypothetical protein
MAVTAFDLAQQQEQQRALLAALAAAQGSAAQRIAVLKQHVLQLRAELLATVSTSSGSLKQSHLREVLSADEERWQHLLRSRRSATASEDAEALQQEEEQLRAAVQQLQELLLSAAEPGSPAGHGHSYSPRTEALHRRRKKVEKYNSKGHKLQQAVLREVMSPEEERWGLLQRLQAWRQGEQGEEQHPGAGGVLCMSAAEAQRWQQAEAQLLHEGLEARRRARREAALA